MGGVTSPSRTLAGNLGHPKKQCPLLGVQCGIWSREFSKCPE